MIVRLVLIAAVIALTLYALHRLALWAERRGWIYYKTNKAPLGAGGMAAMEVASIVSADVEHVLEEQLSERIRADIAESGDEGPDGIRL